MTPCKNFLHQASAPGRDKMFCTNCGKEIAPASKFCAFCGAEISLHGSPPPTDAQMPYPATDTNSDELTELPIRMSPRQSQPVASSPRPWVRFWARLFDTYLASIVAGFAIDFINPGVLESSNDLLLGAALIFVWMFIEAFLLSTAGATPGKWLLKTKISTSSGDKLSFSTALSRSFKVWWRGLGAGLPLVALLTQIVAYHNLEKSGITTWDRDECLVVVHERIGAIRILAAIVFFVSFCLLISVDGHLSGESIRRPPWW